MVARTALGTINHSLLTIEALRARRVPLLGIVFFGAEMQDSQQTICRIAALPALGRLPRLANVTRPALEQAFQGIDLSAIKAAL